MNFRRLKQVCQYGWKDAQTLSQDKGNKKGRMSIFLDILQCFFKYNVWSNQYKKEKLHLQSGEKKKEICIEYQEKNTKRDKWVKEFFNTYGFLNKWSRFKYETSASLQEKRNCAYNKHFKLTNKVFFEYGVIMQKHHYKEGTIKVGKNCKILAAVNIDYTGGVIIGDYVAISEGAKVFTHNHVVDFSGKNESKGCVVTPLVIQDRVLIGSRAIIMPGVSEIGRGALISSCSYVRSQVPPYAIVMGNPAKIVGFRLTPKEIEAFEKENYNEDERIPMDVLEKNFDTYFVKRWKEIKEFTRIKV